MSFDITAGRGTGVGQAPHPVTTRQVLSACLFSGRSVSNSHTPYESGRHCRYVIHTPGPRKVITVWYQYLRYAQTDPARLRTPHTVPQTKKEVTWTCDTRFKILSIESMGQPMAKPAHQVSTYSRTTSSSGYGWEETTYKVCSCGIVLVYLVWHNHDPRQGEPLFNLPLISTRSVISSILYSTCILRRLD